MQKILFTLILILFYCISTAQAQFMEFESWNSVYVDNQKIRYNDLEPLFLPIPEAHKYYTKSLVSKKKANAFGYTSLGSLAVGLLLLEARGDNCRRTCAIQTVSIISVIFVFPISGLVGLIENGHTNRSRKKAVNLYNQHNGIGSLESKLPPQLSLGLGSNGLTFSLTF